MAYVFRIHKDPFEDADFDKGWEQLDHHLEGELLDGIEAGLNIGRMGTSIPSIFARPMLFQTAFKTIVSGTYDESGLNQRLISEVFDMLEFLCQNAGNKKLSTADWIAAEQTSRLKNSGREALVRLGEALDNHLHKIGNPDKITLFFWEDITAGGVKVKTLIGGTSLSTIVFTSPNWARKARSNGWVFNRPDGTRFFGDDVRSLNRRSRDFREMIYDMRMTYEDEFRAQCGGNDGLAKYIWESMSNKNRSVMTPAVYQEKYPAIKNIYAGLLPVSYKAVNPDSSGYRIRPTSTRYAERIDSNGNTVHVPVPMALNDAGLPGVEYVGGASWKPEYKIDEAHVRTVPFFEREIPGNMGIRYPYLTVCDLLEDKIVKLPANVDKRRFYTLFDGESKYLLPLKRLFFEFFNVDDLERVNGHTNRELVEISTQANGAVIVTINMPIVDGMTPYITLSKRYEGNSIVTPAKAVELGFFPFYKVVGRPELNVYSVMLASGERDSLEFYSLNAGKIDKLLSAAMSRTPESRFLHNTKYYDVKGTVDLVEVSLGDGVKALVVPRMKEIELGHAHFDFAIDFGTSNTYIAYKKEGDNEIKTLTFGDAIEGALGETDAQAVFLYSPTSLPTMVDTFQREFMLSTIGVNDSIADFPIKTVVCEVTQFGDQPAMRLFGNINVGFKFKNEISAGNIPNATYDTKLKWALEDNPGNRISGWRVLAFCKQLLWLIKNKALLNGGDERFNVMLTFPEAMLDRSIFLHKATQSGVWLEAEGDLGLRVNGFDRFNEEVTESEAPYYMVVRGTENMLNVDIGGGTTDMFLVRRLDKNGNTLGGVSANYMSVKFAADDLWGDGAGARINTAGQNGFCKYLTGQIAANGENIGGITRLVTSSSDIMAALFSNDSRFKTSVLIRQNQNLRSILLMHYTAILFAIGRMLKHFDAGIPTVLSFTGMGSKYLSLISPNENSLKNFTAGVLRMITGFDVPDGFKLDTHYMDAKEVTAKGALSKANVHDAYHIQEERKGSYVDLGCDRNDDLSYGQLRREINAIRDEARSVFDRYVELLKSPDFGRLTGREFQLSIPKEMIASLSSIANTSFNNVQGAIPPAYDQRAVTDNLFFWFLKNSLCDLSATYYQNANNA